MTSTVFTRRSVMVLATAPAVAWAAPGEVTLGAIRWDAWYEPDGRGERAAVEYALDPLVWRGRAPACATASVKLDLGSCATSKQIDVEINDAREAKLSYWAFCWYGVDSPMQAAWRHYQQSRLRSLIDWCMILGCGNLVSGKPTAVPVLATLMQGVGYQTVEARRPLFFLLHDQTRADLIKGRVAELRAACAAMRGADPYVVMLIGAAPGVVQSTGVDAIGIYSKPNPAPPEAPYKQLATSTEAYWDTLARTGQSVVPTAVTGADRRPRVERPVPWEAAHQRPYEGDGNYYRAGSPDEIATHVRAMVNWVRTRREACPAQTGLIYSWNEHDEGGSTINPSIGDGDKIVRALAKAL